MRMLAIVLVAACGGGPSISADPAANIVSAQCDTLGSLSVSISVEYAVTLQVGQAFVADVQVLGAGPVTNTSEFYSCGFWRSLGGDMGCTRDLPDDPVSETIDHSVTLNFAEPFTPPISVSVFANALIAPGSTVTVGANDFEDVPCF